MFKASAEKKVMMSIITKMMQSITRTYIGARNHHLNQAKYRRMSEVANRIHQAGKYHDQYRKVQATMAELDK